ncbi:hypothetical protein KO02_15145 [Sphingobacterium sp. ML3W]|uniref:hypothetical protein n=1 Tax=Sphingobacterium sp. ML3W TaxID=1538644 RepID=UPI0004F928FD|nr:hypothetical protein [Sphingobacterium sp. ML3W]AIM37874.1 hypothetical protein KO02_15145 [Sphingobacterium sp. ML3W]
MRRKDKKIYAFLYIILTLLLLADVWAIQTLKISLAGYWSDRILFWIWAAATIAFLVFFWKNIFTKIYFFVLLLGFILSIVAMMLPFYAILFASTGSERTMSYTPEDGKYRLQMIQSVMARPHLQIIKNKGLFEKVVVDTRVDFLKNDSIGYQDIREIEVLKDTKDSLILKFYSPSRVLIEAFAFKE